LAGYVDAFLCKSVFPADVGVSYEKHFGCFWVFTSAAGRWGRSSWAFRAQPVRISLWICGLLMLQNQSLQWVQFHVHFAAVGAVTTPPASFNIEILARLRWFGFFGEYPQTQR
jgi:hypothetical protein